MATWSRFAATAALACASAIALAGGSPMAEFAQAQQANRSALREYSWKSRPELN